MPTKLEARVSRHDREIAAIRKLLLVGMKMLNKAEARADRLEARQDRLDARVDRLAATVDRFVKSMGSAGNGHSKTDLR